MFTKKACLVLSLIIFISGIYSASLAKSASHDKSAGNKIVIEYEFSAPVVTNRDGYDYVQIDQTQGYERTGAPVIPVRPASILIPFGRKVVSCTVIAMDTQQLDGSYMLAPAQERYPLSYKGKIERTPPDPAIYGQSNPWPKAGHEQMDTQSKRGYQIFTVNLFPLQYIPTTGQISYSTRLRLEINLAPDTASHIVRPTKEAKSRLNKLVDNPGAAMETYFPESDSIQGLDARTESLPSGGPYQYVIITNAALEAAPGPWNFQALRDAKLADGLTATIVTTEWIYANYSGTKPSGGSDDQTKIRNFLIDAYQNWGTQYVLLGGTNAIVPGRLFWVDDGSDTGYMPVDMYYGCVEPSTCTFDYDADNKYGESTDGVGGGDVDLYAEIYVGRAAVDNYIEVTNFIRKTLTYDTVSGEYLLRAAMLGEYLGFGGVSQYGTDGAEQVRLGGTYDGYFTYGFENYPQSAYFNFDTTGCLPANPSACWPLYDSETYDWTPDELITLMNGGVHIFYHDGHANYTCDMKLYTSALIALTNTEYFFAYSQGCMAGGFDTPNCFAEVITSMEHGAFAVIMNSRYGWGKGDSTDGPSQRFARQFWDAVLGEQILEMGRANQDSKEDNLWDINGPCIRFCYYELTLFGDPQQKFKFEQYPLSITKTDDVNDGDCLESGSQITYTMNYSYADEPNLSDITNVSIVDNLPEDVDFASASGGGVYNSGLHTVTWNIGTLQAGNNGLVTLTVEVLSPETGSTLSNYCELKSGSEILNRADENTRTCWPDGYIIYVDASAAGANNGTSWQNAYVNLQDALYRLLLSPPGQYEHVQLWVAAGTYRPDKGVYVGLNDMQATFQLVNNVAVYGGFPVGGGTWQSRNPNTYPTILSGDIGTIGNITDNSKHVVNGSRTNTTAVLDGFTITGGNGFNGGGMYNVSGSPTVNNCIFTNNQAVYGGGMYNEDSSSPVVTNCAFNTNKAWTDREDIPYTCGAAIYNEYGSSPTVTNCSFIGNVAWSDYASAGYGGGISSWYDCSPVITNCSFVGNTGAQDIFNLSSSLTVTGCDFISNSYGTGIENQYSNATITNCKFIGCSSTPNNSYSAMSNWVSSPLVVNCLFTGNVASDSGGYGDGGAMNNGYNSSPTIVNCTFSRCSALVNGGAIWNYNNSNPTITNCIFWGNTAPTGPQIYNSSGCTPVVTYTDIQGGWTGTGNTNTNPLFIDADGADNIVGTADDNLQLPSNSPCLDAGKNSAVPSGVTTDLAGNPRFTDAPVADTGNGTPPIVDMGTYEYFISGPAASNPTPANGATNVSLTQDLSWTAGSGATSHDVYFGTSSPGTFRGNQVGTTYDTGTMSANATYYWRIDEHNAGGTTTGAVWSFTTAPPPPGAASNPTPVNGATSVSQTQDISWTAGSGATSHDVYFGTANPPSFIGNQTVVTYDTGTMLANTTYYWRIDEKNAGGTTTGTVWSFTTILPPPAPATAPSPANAATNVSLTADISWTAGSGAASHDVYFGTSSPGTFRGNQTGTTFDTGTMSTNTTYYWRIDEKNAGGTTTGTVWSFTTVPPPPGAASNPTPTNGATNVSLTQDLSWTAGSGATSRDVYFGTVNPPPLKGNQTATTYDTGTMSGNKTYYWRIDEKNAGGTTTGTVWSFTTVAATPTFVAAGTARSGTGAITVPWPTHQAGDVALLFVESCGGQAATLSTPAGFANVTNSPQYTGATTYGTRLTVFWCRATSSSMSSPVVTDPGNHVYGRILTFRNVTATGNPWDITAGGTKATASTTTTFGAVTTSVNNTLIVLAAARDNDSSSAAWSNWSNANLSSLTERSDGGTTSGNGGGIGVATGIKAAAGSTGNTTATVTSSVDGHMTIALKS